MWFTTWRIWIVSYTDNGFEPRRSFICGYTYNLFDESGRSGNPGLITETRPVNAAYFYPFSSHQLSVLREEPTVIIDLAKESELYNGVGEKGFVIVPQETDIKLRDNIEYYLEKAGLIEKTTTTKAPRKGR